MMELAARLHLKINVQSCDHSRAFIFDWSLTLAGYIIEDNNKSLYEFELCPILPSSHLGQWS